MIDKENPGTNIKLNKAQLENLSQFVYWQGYLIDDTPVEPVLNYSEYLILQILEWAEQAAKSSSIDFVLPEWVQNQIHQVNPT